MEHGVYTLQILDNSTCHKLLGWAWTSGSVLTRRRTSSAQRWHWSRPDWWRTTLHILLVCRCSQ